MRGLQSSRKKLKVAIIILSVLLLFSAGGLTARYIYLANLKPAQATATVAENQIGEGAQGADVASSGASKSESSGLAQSGEEVSTGNQNIAEGSRPALDKPQAVKLELYAGQPGDNEKFEVSNMLPGDVETKYFCLQVSHDADLALFFRADVVEETKALGEVLHIRVTHMETGKVLCDAPFREVDAKEFSETLLQTEQGQTTANYQIEVSLDPSVGNEYQAAALQADFSWYVKDEEALTPPPQTGENTNIVLWIVLAVSALLLLLILWKWKKEGERHA